MYRKFGKRLFDILFSSLAIVGLFPLFLLIGALIFFTDFGPVIFVQHRVGRNGKMFKFFKFRSMPVDTKDMPSDLIDSVEITAVGRFIRRSNIDELPQLYNILKGDMSIVGPRPPIESQNELVNKRELNGSLSARPGLTGLAQVNSFDGMSLEDKAKFDGRYVDNLSLVLDLNIIFRTFNYLMKPPPKY